MQIILKLAFHKKMPMIHPKTQTPGILVSASLIFLYFHAIICSYLLSLSVYMIIYFIVNEFFYGEIVGQKGKVGHFFSERPPPPQN